jgi:hypothetical protein
MAPFGPSEQAVGPDASEPTVASGAPASRAASHCTVTVDVESDGLHEAPAGSGPSLAERVTVTGPGVAHVNVVAAAFVEENDPLGADHAYVIAAGFGAVAVAVSDTPLPTKASDGLAAAPPATAQLYVWPVNAADPASGACTLHWRRMVTFVVARLVTEKFAEPPHVTVPSAVVPVTDTE